MSALTDRTWTCDCAHAVIARSETKNPVMIHRELGNCPSCGSSYDERLYQKDDDD